jgi:hypothetical protein
MQSASRCNHLPPAHARSNNVQNAMTNRVISNNDWHESEAQSFIVKLWMETTNAGTARWHGNITHVPSGQRKNIRDVTEISMLIAQHLRGLGVDLGMKWRLWLWLFRS